MKKSNVKRFDMGGYTAGMEAMGRRAAEKAANKRDSDYKSERMAAEKARRDEQIALDKADAIEEFAPEKYLIPGMAARRAIPAALRAGADILRNEFMGPQTSEGLPTSQRLKDVRSRVAPGRLVRNKADMERIAGYRDQYKPGTSNTRNAKLRGEAEEMGIPYKEYLKGKSRAERASMGLEAEQTSTNAMDRFKKGGKVGKVMGEFKSGSLKSSSGQKVANRKQAMAIAMSEAGKSMKTKKYAAGGKTDKRSFSSGDVFSNYDVGADPFLKSRKGGTFTDKEMKDGLTKDEIMRKTTPKETPKAKKYAAGGNVKKMADGGMSGRPQHMSPMPKRPPDYGWSNWRKYNNPPPPPRPTVQPPAPTTPTVPPRPVAPRPTVQPPAPTTPTVPPRPVAPRPAPPGTGGNLPPPDPRDGATGYNAPRLTVQPPAPPRPPVMPPVQPGPSVEPTEYKWVNGRVVPWKDGKAVPSTTEYAYAYVNGKGQVVPVPRLPDWVQRSPTVTPPVPPTPLVEPEMPLPPSPSPRMTTMKRGGKVGESKAMVKKEVEFFKKKGAPKSMIEHEKKEAKGMKKMAKGGMSCMKKGGDVQKFAKGGSIDGCAVRGKTKLPRGGK